MGSASLPELGFIPKTPSPGQRRRSVSDAVLAVSLTECFFTTHTPCRQSCCGNRIAPPNPAVATGLLHPILLWQQDCSTQSCCGNRIAPPNPAVATGLLHPILLWQQDCSTQSCCGNRIAPVFPRKRWKRSTALRPQTRRPDCAENTGKTPAAMP